jgi:hypothetical protein
MLADRGVYSRRTDGFKEGVYTGHALDPESVQDRVYSWYRERDL